MERGGEGKRVVWKMDVAGFDTATPQLIADSRRDRYRTLLPYTAEPSPVMRRETIRTHAFPVDRRAGTLPRHPGKWWG
jgi:hypothetical protein